MNLFRFIRGNHTRLQDSLLLDAIFSAFWEEQRKLVLMFGFIPFICFFIVANFYYSQCLFGSERDAKRSMWFSACKMFFAEDDCNL